MDLQPKSKLRNKMSRPTETVNALLHIKYGLKRHRKWCCNYTYPPEILCKIGHIESHKDRKGQSRVAYKLLQMTQYHHAPTKLRNLRMMYKCPLGILVTVAKNEVRLWEEYFPLRLLSKHFFFLLFKVVVRVSLRKHFFFFFLFCLKIWSSLYLWFLLKQVSMYCMSL